MDSLAYEIERLCRRLGGVRELSNGAEQFRAELRGSVLRAKAINDASLDVVSRINDLTEVQWSSERLRPNVAEVVQSLAKAIAPEHARNEVPEGLCIVTVWPLLRHVLRILAENALEAPGDEQREVTVSAKICDGRRGREACVAVSNPGRFESPDLHCVRKRVPVRRIEERYGSGLLTANWAMDVLGGFLEFDPDENNVRVTIRLPI